MTPLLSICIPTFDRPNLLKETIEHLIAQITEYKLQKVYEIVVFNDNGEDRTHQYMTEIQKKHSFIRYVMQKKRLGLRKAIEYVPTRSRGTYIWFFSDDDLPAPGALQYVSSLLQKENIGIVFGNVDDFNEHGIYQTNMLAMDDDVNVTTRKEFFVFLATKIAHITYFTSYITNFIIKRDLYMQHADINKQYDSPYNMTPLVTPFFYTNLTCPIRITKKSIALRRMDNESWVQKDPMRKLQQSYNITSYHFGNIQRINWKDIPMRLHFYLSMHTLKYAGVLKTMSIPGGMQVVKFYFYLEGALFDWYHRMRAKGSASHG